MSLSADIQVAAWRLRRAVRSRFFVTQLTPWRSGLAVTAGDFVQSFGLAWQAQSSGTTGATAPNNSSGAASNDGAITWLHIPLLLVQPPTI